MRLLLACLLLLGVFTPSQAQSELFGWNPLFAYREPEAIIAGWTDDDIVLLATGDVLLARSINARMVAANDFTFPFAKLKDLLARADIAWVNLETPLVTGCIPRYDGLNFCGDPRGVAGLQSAGIDVVNIANNHTENYGLHGVVETMQHLKVANMAITGLPEPVILTIHGKRIGLMGFNSASASSWINGAKPEMVQAQIEATRPSVDYLIVSFHWGQEYRSMQDNRQRDLGRLAIDSGADVVIGHHPHWVQGVEIYRDKPILYSLGNFIFDQGTGGWFNEGVIAVINFQANGRLQLHLIPIIIEDRATPRLANRHEAETILLRIAEASSILETWAR
jgi:poly-gamma-glutamate capsule biosynthesis protein CapA/YwtB (metallophosphatase superfamily)